MNEQIQEAIECWASRPTWFSSHPSDVKELRKAVSSLKKLGVCPDQEELKEIIYNRVKDLPSLLGTPNNIEGTAGDFASKILAKL